jgi:hypothetical protein
MRLFGHHIVLVPEIQCTHLKRWTFWNMVTTDFRHRGVVWMWLLLQEGKTPGSQSLNLKVTEKACTALVGLALLLLAGAALLQTTWPLYGAAAALLIIAYLNRRFYAFLRRHHGTAFMLRCFPLHLVYYFVAGTSALYGALMRNLFGTPLPPDDVEAQEELGLQTWPPAPVRPAATVWNGPRLPAGG